MVTNSRASKRTPGTWRRRQCMACEAIFTSRESADLSQTHVVQCAKNSLRPFSRENLLISVYESCKHRKAALEDATALTDTIIMALLGKSGDGTITTTQIKAATNDILAKFDSVAATYYGAYYT